MSEQDPVPDFPLEQADIVDVQPDSIAGERDFESFMARKRADTLLVNRRHFPSGKRSLEQSGIKREVEDIGRAGNGDKVLTNTEPGEDGWLGNPYILKSAGGEYTREESVYRYRKVLHRMAAENPEFRSQLLNIQGKVLIGWCVPELCHGDAILEWLDLHGE